MTHPVRAAIEVRDIDALAALFADDISFFSPVAFPLLSFAESCPAMML